MGTGSGGMGRDKARPIRASIGHTSQARRVVMRLHRGMGKGGGEGDDGGEEDEGAEERGRRRGPEYDVAFVVSAHEGTKTHEDAKKIACRMHWLAWALETGYAAGRRQPSHFQVRGICKPATSLTQKIERFALAVQLHFPVPWP